MLSANLFQALLSSVRNFLRYLPMFLSLTNLNFGLPTFHYHPVSISQTPLQLYPSITILFLPRKNETIDWNFCELRILKFTVKAFWICNFIWKQLHQNIVELRLWLFNRINLFQWRWIVVLRLSDTVHEIWIVKIRFVNRSFQLWNYD